MKKDKRELTFLIVDHSYEKRAHITNILLALGYKRFERESDGSKAFRTLKRQPIDFIICQWKMPGMNGLSLLKVLSVDVELFKIPFFIVTQKITRDKVIEAGVCGVSGILVEPVKKEDIEMKIENVTKSPVSKTDKRFAMLYTEAKRLTEEEQYDQALIIYEKMLKIRETPEIHYNIGYIKIAQGKYDEAFIDFRRAILVSNFQANAYSKMGEIHLLKGNKSEAEKCFSMVKDVQIERDMDKEASKALKEALVLVNATKGKADTAANDLTSNIYITSNIFNSLGIIYRKNRKIKEAIRHYKMALKVDPDDDRICFNLGRAYLENRQTVLAKEIFERALKLNPDLDVARQKLEEIRDAT